ncbi:MULTISPECIES: hypothetical protein [unclassified Nocardia]|uniref:hypothetical protein n=1 Tax=unclassified Nocardia TaxID=2637762 RepID=UPI001CE46CDF|nr:MULTISPECIES: hypothetical protein [unclassified Nocardia]
MAYTTPPRPVDVAAVLPALAPFARTATRLHPRPGNPSPQDSSVGGPLLWPAAEPWPHCDGPHDLNALGSPAPLADVRLIRDAARSGGTMTPQVREAYDRIHPRWQDRSPVPRPYPGSIAMLPVAQLYARDVPNLPAPAGADLLQVLWCPFDHPEDDEYMPKTALFWRSAAEVTDLRTDPPQPAVIQTGDYLPEPCTIAPEQVIEYPRSLELDDDLREQLKQLTQHAARLGVEADDIADGVIEELYNSNLAVAPGWKVGGWIGWGTTDPYPQPCPTCGTPTRPLLTIATSEWDSSQHSWIPYEDRDTAVGIGYPDGPGYPTKIVIARGYNQIISVCPASSDHPRVQLMQ